MRINVCDRCGKTIHPGLFSTIKAKKSECWWMTESTAELCDECYKNFKIWMKPKEDNHN